jgi:O-antigen ligase
MIVFILFLIIPNPINQRFFSIINFQDNSVNERIDLWQDGLEITRNNFWGGVGIGNLSETVQPGSNLRTPIYAHNLFLDFSAELGFFGGLVIFLIIITPVKNYFQPISSKKLMLASIFIIILIHSLFETPFYSVHLLPLILTFLAI